MLSCPALIALWLILVTANSTIFSLWPILSTNGHYRKICRLAGIFRAEPEFHFSPITNPIVTETRCTGKKGSLSSHESSDCPSVTGCGALLPPPPRLLQVTAATPSDPGTHSECGEIRSLSSLPPSPHYLAVTSE